MTVSVPHWIVPSNCSAYCFRRHYGGLQGLDKQATVEKYGTEQVNVWRRSYDIPPPECAEDSPHNPVNDPAYRALSAAERSKLPRTRA